MAGELFYVAQLAGAVAILALAGWLLALDFASRLNRSLALVLVLRAAVTILNRLTNLDPARAIYWQTTREYFYLALIPAMVYFAATFAFPRANARGRIIRGGAFALGVGAELLYLYDHCLDRCVREGNLRELGPLTLLVDGSVLGFALLGLGLAWAARRAHGPHGVGLGLAAMAFLLQALLEGATALAFMVRLGPDAAAVSFLPSVWAALVFPLRLAALPVALAGVALLARLARERSARVDALLAAPAAAALASGFVIGSASDNEGTLFSLGLLLSGVWLLVLPLLVGYAAIKYRLFDLDVRVQRGIARAVIAGAFLAVFFVVSEVAQNWLSDTLGVGLGGAAAGLLLFALAPLERMGRRVSRALLPAPRESDGLALYRDQAAVVWADGAITRKERLLLDQLRERLGISREDAARIEWEASAPGEASPQR